MDTTRQDIKKVMTDKFISNPIIIALYGLTVGRTFEEEFSKVSLENILFDIFSFGLFVHQQIVESNAQNSRPQNLPNFRNSILDFHDGLDLVWKDGAFSYNLTGVEDAEERKIIKRCAVLESNDGELVVKISGADGPVTEDQKNRIIAYIRQIKVPGVSIRLVNQIADTLRTEITAYVDADIIDLSNGKLLSVAGDIYPVKDAVQSYLSKLEFNGAFVKNYFINELQGAKGIPLVEINSLEWKYAAFPFIDAGAFRIAEAGHFEISEANLTINYLPYAVVNG